MKPLALGIGILALGFVASTPARADFVVVQFESGYCQIWWDSSSTPWGAGWKKIAVAPDYSIAWSTREAAYHDGTCR